jgi:hypothetical protein
MATKLVFHAIKIISSSGWTMAPEGWFFNALSYMLRATRKVNAHHLAMVPFH